MKNLRNLGMAVVLIVAAVILTACGGSGNTTPPPPKVCMDSTWSPDPSTVPLGDKFIQTSNCETKRPAVGTKNLWKERDGASVTTVFKSYAGSIQDISATPDMSGGSLILGRDSDAKNNKGILARLDATGNETWRVQIGSPLGNTFIPHELVTDGNRIIDTHERLPLHDFTIYAYDMNGNGGFISETNIGYGLASSKTVIDGNNLLISRIQPSTPLPAPIPFSTTALIYASMVSSDAPISVVPTINSEFASVDAAGINVVGRDATGQWQYMKYARDLSVLQAPTALPTGMIVHDVKTVGNVTYIAGAVDGILTLTEIDNPAFRNTAGIPVGTDKVQLGSDASGNLYVSVGNRIGKVDKITGEISTIKPPAVPANVPWHVSGNNIYFVVNGNALEILPVSQL